MTKYIVHRRFKNKAICGDVNLAAKTECDCDGDFITYKGNKICVVTSENAHQYFAINSDNCGMRRGKLTQEIQRVLSKHDNNHQIRWDKIWNDKLCQKYKHPEHNDYWLWNHEFFNAPIKDLEYIAALIGVKI